MSAFDVTKETLPNPIALTVTFRTVSMYVLPEKKVLINREHKALEYTTSHEPSSAVTIAAIPSHIRVRGGSEAYVWNND